MITFKGQLIPTGKAITHTLQAGLEPAVFTIEGPRNFIQRIWDNDNDQPGVLAIGADKYGGMILIDIIPGRDHWYAQLVIQDLRANLDYITLARDYNLVERTGLVRLVGPGDLDEQQPISEVRYRPHSLNGRKPWTLREALTDALQEVKDRLGIDFEPVPKINRKIPFEDFSETDEASVFLGKLIARAPGYKFRFTKGAKLGVFDSTDQPTTEEEIKKLGPVIIGGGDVKLNDRSRLRPSKVNVYTVREQELRFDHDEDAEERGFSIDPLRPPRVLQQILQNPVRAFELNGRNVGENTVISLVEFFAQLPNQSDPSLLPDTFGKKTFGKLGFDVCRKHLRSTTNIQAYTFANNGTTLQNHAALIRELKASFRRNFRIIPQWRQLMKEFKPTRVALFDPRERSFGISRPYTDLTFIPSMRSIFNRAKTLAFRATLGVVHTGYNALLKNGQSVTTARVVVRDQEAGTLRLRFKDDSYDEVDGVVVGHLTLLPETTDKNRIGGLVAGIPEIPLKSGWKLAIVLTCIQAAPNNLGRYHKEVRTPAQAEAILGRPVGPSNGPELDIFIAQTPTTTARFAWDDAHATEIENAFFTGTSAPPRKLLVNKDVIDALADGAAAAAYSGLLDTYDGEITTTTGRGMDVKGQIASVSTFRPPRQGALTKIVFAGRVDPGDLYGFLPSAIQRKVFGTVQ